MTVLEVVRYYHLELVDKTYKDVYGNIHSINLKTLADLEVRDFNINLMLNKAVITVIDIEKYDKKEDR